MPTTADYIEFVMDQLSRAKAQLRYRKMFGEYCVYANDKPVLLVCDNQVYAKMIPGIEPLMREAAIGKPYEGAKPHYILDIEDHELSRQVVETLERDTPLPKPRKKKS